MLALPSLVDDAQEPSRVRALKRAISEALSKTVSFHCNGCDEWECDHDGAEAAKRDQEYLETIREEVYAAIVSYFETLQSANAVQPQPTNEDAEERQNQS